MDRIRRLGEPGDLGWIVLANGELYAKEYGWDISYEGLVARIVADFANSYDPEREAAWIAEVDGRRVGSIACVAAEEEGTAKLRLLIVDPAARGRGIGGRLVDTCIEFAREVGYRRMKLWTVSVLTSARKIYQSRGFQLVGEEAGHMFGHDLVGQDWALDL
ncbi:GNAT family N-acetyltransferase [Thermocrispum municipale]|uniref:GNAT family N-acetyltransferase n=1 Tax=Thermocrispum municipale TaxID=37926 RepID=UPI0004263946|nr:GNAT family N-acetyltransferase [Thermocrispum municipale]